MKIDELQNKLQKEIDNREQIDEQNQDYKV